MKKYYYVLTHNQQDVEDLFAYLKSKYYAYGDSFKNWDNPNLSGMNVEHNALFGLDIGKGNIEPVPWNRIMVADIESTMNQAISVYDTKMMIDALEPLKEPTELNKEPRKTQAELIKDMEQEVESKAKHRLPAKFAKISERQIVARFVSKNHTDNQGNPQKLCKIVLPSADLSKSPIMIDGKPISQATIVVPEFTIQDDQYSKDPNRKIVSLRPDYQYNVSYPGTEKDEHGYTIRDQVKVSGIKLYEAFKYKGRERNLDDRINEARTQKEHQAHEETKEIKEPNLDKAV